jgi:hypothetical protein
VIPIYPSFDHRIFEARSTEASSIALVNDHTATKMNSNERYKAPLTLRLFHALHDKKILIIELTINTAEYDVKCNSIGEPQYLKNLY